MRQAIDRRYDPPPHVCISTLAYDYPADYAVPEHGHGSDQLIYAVSGVMEVFSGRSTWLIPPNFALWIPSEMLHRIRMHGCVSMRTLYVKKGLVKRAASECVVLYVTPLLRELILETVKTGRIQLRNKAQRLLGDLLILQLENATAAPTSVTLPTDARALAVARVVLDHPREATSLLSLCEAAGASVRTMQRIFLKEVGMDFESWRRQVRLTRAIQLLIAGCSVKQVAFEVGYSQPSSFVEAFRRTFNATPKVWVSSLKT